MSWWKIQMTLKIKFTTKIIFHELLTQMKKPGNNKMF